MLFLRIIVFVPIDSNILFFSIILFTIHIIFELTLSLLINPYNLTNNDISNGYLNKVDIFI